MRNQGSPASLPSTEPFASTVKLDTGSDHNIISETVALRLSLCRWTASESLETQPWAPLPSLVRCTPGRRPWPHAHWKCAPVVPVNVHRSWLFVGLAAASAATVQGDPETVNHHLAAAWPGPNVSESHSSTLHDMLCTSVSSN